ncbi:hypothetical protein HRI_003016000 [Hibiscus trionum]|uniref:Uncharacterized protein n=1 Tax=Hibiscus trionum TaxID=183268 RepID=A0A9W7M7W4_HIBTR|nr:hypothetical protein HRI_003016000 [Hibiscus trionum]
MADASGVGDGDYRHEYDQSSGVRRSKKQRIPKRGPGVAELEKILREQEQTDGHMEKGNGIGFGGISSSSSLPVSAVHGHGNGSSRFGCVNVGGADGRSKGVYIGRSGVFLPEQTLLPISWGEAPKMATGLSFPVLVSNGSASPPMLQNNRLSMMDLFPLPATTTPSSSPAVQFHNLEPPSSQKPSHHEEDKMMSTKRLRPSFPVENRQPPPTSRQKSSSSSSESEVSGYSKGLFSFLLQPEELQRPCATSAEDLLCLKTEKCCTDKTRDFIDLNLKL